MELKCKHCGHIMHLIGMPTYIKWVCEMCFEISDNYGFDLREGLIEMRGVF